MSFFNAAKKLMGLNNEDHLAANDPTNKSAHIKQKNPNFVEHRAFDRYTIRDQRFCALTIGDQSYEVCSLSYGGLALVASHLPFPKVISGAYLKVLDQNCLIDMEQAHKQMSFAGYQFKHERADSLLFLRNVLEGLRIGHTIKIIDKSLIKDEKRTSNTHYFRGEGPTDICVKMDEQEAEPEEILLTFLYEGNYVSCQFRKGELFTSASIDQVGLSPRMATDNETNFEVLRKSIYILLGIDASQHKALFHKFIEALLSRVS